MLMTPHAQHITGFPTCRLHMFGLAAKQTFLRCEGGNDIRDALGQSMMPESWLNCSPVHLAGLQL